MKSVVIVGGTSQVEQEIAKIHALAHDKLFLIGRNETRLQQIASDLIIRGAVECEVMVQDLVEFGTHTHMLDGVYEWGQPDVVYFAHGVLPDQKAAENSFVEMKKSFDVNAMSVISILTELANRMEKDRRGQIVVISSVAGDRGRKSNYVYGAAKGVVSIFCQGLRNRLFDSGVGLTTVKPGFIDTPMTAEFEKGALWASPSKVAQDIVRGASKKRNVIYTPSFWLVIMLIIKSIPEFIFKRLSL